jgi:PKD domain
MRTLAWIFTLCPLLALERPGVEYKIFQFPPDRIPTIDGKTADWDIVPESYVIGMDQLKETVKGRGFKYDKNDLDVRVRVGWVRGMNHLYFLYEAYDNHWEFEPAQRNNDLFEVVVDGDLSGGPLISAMHPFAGIDKGDAFFTFHGVHAQNYHIFTPAPNRDWAMVWGCQPWIKELPYANAAYDYNFKQGEPGKLTLEFWITPFDYAPYEGPARAVESRLVEDKRIGLSWAVLDYDGPQQTDYRGFWNLSHKTTMYGNASDLVAFRLMPLESRFVRPLEARWSFQVLDMNRRMVAFQDESRGQITTWRWEFGDGSFSSEQHPIHRYGQAGEYVVRLFVEGPAGKAQWTKIRDLVVK